MRTQACAFQTALRYERGSRPEPTSAKRIRAPIQLLHKRFLAYASFLLSAPPQAIIQPPRQDKSGMKPALKIFLKAKRRPASVVTIPHRVEPATRTRTQKDAKSLTFSASPHAHIASRPSRDVRRFFKPPSQRPGIAKNRLSAPHCLEISAERRKKGTKTCFLHRIRYICKSARNGKHLPGGLPTARTEVKRTTNQQKKEKPIDRHYF